MDQNVNYLGSGLSFFLFVVQQIIFSTFFSHGGHFSYAFATASVSQDWDALRNLKHVPRKTAETADTVDWKHGEIDTSQNTVLKIGVKTLQVLLTTSCIFEILKTFGILRLFTKTVINYKRIFQDHISYILALTNSSCPKEGNIFLKWLQYQ